jgi:hypothetical protein
MDMDDPGTPGPRGIEVNFVGSMEQLGPGRTSQGLFDANVGIGERLQLKYERPYVTQQESGLPIQQGLGATELGIKWRFIDHNELEIALYPQYQFDDAFTVKDADGSPTASEGRSVYLPVLVSQGVGQNYTLAVNYGYRRNLDGRGDDNNLAMGLGRTLGGSGRIMAEVFSERDARFHNRQTDARLGITFLPRSFESSSIEAPLFASIGHSIGATEEGEHSTTYTLGFSLIRKPQS